jgi:hypothetical protein
MVKPPGSRDMVNDAAVQGKLTFLSGEICFPRGEKTMGAGLRTIPKGVESPPAPKASLSAFQAETSGGRKQKSAEAIVAVRSNPGRAVKGRTSRNKEEPCATRRR